MPKSQQTLLQQRLQCFVNFIAPEKDESPTVKRFFQQIDDCIRKHAINEGFTIAAVQFSGSYAKRTGLRRHMTGGSAVEGHDVDIAVILEDKKSNGKPIAHSLIPQFKSFLKEQWEDHQVGQTKSSATLSIPKQKLSFDVVPLIKTSRPNILKLIRLSRNEKRTTSVQGHIEFVRKLNRGGSHINFNNGLRLVKWWRYHQQMQSHVFDSDGTAEKVPSFLLDLLCARAFLNSPQPLSYAQMLYDWFRELAMITKQRTPVHFGNFRENQGSLWQVIDPIDPTNNVVEKWLAYKIDELARWFQQSRNWMMQAMHHDSDGRDDLSMNCLNKLFGPAIKTICQQPE